MIYTVDMVNTVDTVYTIQTALHCLNNSYTHIVRGKVRTLLECADGLLSKMLGDWTGLDCCDN